MARSAKKIRKRKAKKRTQKKAGRPRKERPAVESKGLDERFDRRGGFARSEGDSRAKDEIFGPLPFGRF